MQIITIILIALALSIDAFTVTIACSAVTKERTIFERLKPPLAFGLFQGLMPILGWLAGENLKSYISNTDHYIAFIILAVIGGKMILDSFKRGKNKCEEDISYSRLLLLSIATSIDALVVGLSLSLIKSGILIPSLIIGIITFLVCIIGSYIGDRIGEFFGKKVQIAGGIILIGIGLKILIDHIF